MVPHVIMPLHPSFVPWAWFGNIQVQIYAAKWPQGYDSTMISHGNGHQKKPLTFIYLWLNDSKSCPKDKGRLQLHNYNVYHCEICCMGLLWDKKPAKINIFWVCLSRIFASVGPFSGMTRCFMVQIDPLYLKNRYIGHMSTRSACLWSPVLVLWVSPLFVGSPHGIICCCYSLWQG